MAAPLTEVTLAVRLPNNPLSNLLTPRPHARAVIAPLSMNGNRSPQRLLVSVHGVETGPGALEEALTWLLEDIERIDLDGTGIQSFLANLRPDIAERIEQYLDIGLDGVLGDIIHRPCMITGDQAYIGLVTTRGGPLEEGMKRLVERLNGDRTGARLVRLAPHRPMHSPGTYEETLTAKQAEFLRVALALGLYDTPRRITLDAIAGLFGISKAAAHNRMRGAERKILHEYFGM